MLGYTQVSNELIEELIEKLDGASGRLIVQALKDKTIMEAMEMINEVSIELGELCE